MDVTARSGLDHSVVSEASTSGRRADLLIYGTVLALALLGAVVAVVGSDDEPEATTAAPPSTAPPESEEQAERAPPDAPAIVPNLPSVPDLRAEPPPARPTGEEDPRFVVLGAEMRFLSHARELLAERPAEALAVLEQHRRAHPQGVLREEREAFAIEALVALEDREAAERRYYDFLRDYPRSELVSRLAALMR